MRPVSQETRWQGSRDFYEWAEAGALLTSFAPRGRRFFGRLA
jgi:hypothetical protein